MHTAIRKVEVVVVESRIQELLPVVDLVVEPDDARHVLLVVVVKVGLWRVCLDAVHIGNRRLGRAAVKKKNKRRKYYSSGTLYLYMCVYIYTCIYMYIYMNK